MNELNKFVRIVKLINVRNIRRTLNFIKHNGLKGLKKKILHSAIDPLHYNEWFQHHKISEDELELQRQAEFDYKPLISILVPTFNTDEVLLKELLESIMEQTYSNWELCIADASIANDNVASVLKESYIDNRIRYKKLKKNEGISENTNQALKMATGEFIVLVDHDDFLEKNALYEIVKVLQNKKIDIVYTDEDKYDNITKEYMEPNFKPDFNIDLLRSYNYITHLFVVRKSIMVRIGGLRGEFDGAQDYDLIFRAIEESKNIYHIPKVLYHWRICGGSTADNPKSKMYCYEAGKKAIQGNLDRTNIDAIVVHEGLLGVYHVKYKVNSLPLVSIIIPNMDHVKDLNKCISSIKEKTKYKNIEIIIVENNSRESETFLYYEVIKKQNSDIKVVEWKNEFNFSAIINYGVSFANGEYLLILNNDTEMITEDAIEEMLGVCMRDDVGIVGAKLLYSDNTIQHAGVVLGFSGYAQHIFLNLPDNEYGYLRRARVNCDYSAVTAACLMVKKELFKKVGGFTEAFKVAGNDVDFCLKVRKLGYLIVYNAFSKWYHYESKSRGYEDTEEKKSRFESEVAYFRQVWREELEKGDPYYNINFPLNLAPFTLD